MDLSPEDLAFLKKIGQVIDATVNIPVAPAPTPEPTPVPASDPKDEASA